MTETKRNKSKGTRILSCVCDHPAQDRLHGRGFRVFNHAPGKGGINPNRFRCTVCNQSREHYEKDSK